MSFNVKVKKAKREDMTSVVKLIKELAAHENMEYKIKVDAEMLITDGFETVPPCFGCFVAEDCKTNSIVGFAFYYHYYSTWTGKCSFLEDFYVQEKYRNVGIGSKLLLNVVREAYNTGTRLDFHVVSTNPVVKFYKKLGASNISEEETWQLFKIEEDKLKLLLEKNGINALD